jgi:hypothetical protein
MLPPQLAGHPPGLIEAQSPALREIFISLFDIIIVNSLII